MSKQITLKSTVDRIVEGSPISLASELPKKVKTISENHRHANIAKRLENKFGLGDKAHLRRIFYERCQAAVEKYGDRAYAQICEAALDAQKATSPGRFFCAAVKSRLELRGMGVWTSIV